MPLCIHRDSSYHSPKRKSSRKLIQVNTKLEAVQCISIQAVKFLPVYHCSTIFIFNDTGRITLSKIEARAPLKMFYKLSVINVVMSLSECVVFNTEIKDQM